jgi:hypothetical protein
MSSQDPINEQSTGGVSSEEKTMSLIAHLLGILTWFIGPLIVWLINKDQPNKSFVNYHAKEAVNFQITITIAYVVAYVLLFVSFGLLFFMPMLVWMLNVVLCIIAGVSANKGENYRYPFALRLVK